MAQTTRHVCDRQKLKYPVTYVAPGNAPWLTRSLVKAVYGDKFGYRSACVYPHSAAKVFNELDPDGDAPYAMQWGDVGDDVGPCGLPVPLRPELHRLKPGICLCRIFLAVLAPVIC